MRAGSSAFAASPAGVSEQPDSMPSIQTSLAPAPMPAQGQPTLPGFRSAGDLAYITEQRITRINGEAATGQEIGDERCQEE